MAEAGNNSCLLEFFVEVELVPSFAAEVSFFRDLADQLFH